MRLVEDGHGLEGLLGGEGDVDVVVVRGRMWPWLGTCAIYIRLSSFLEFVSIKKHKAMPSGNQDETSPEREMRGARARHVRHLFRQDRVGLHHAQLQRSEG